MDSETERPPVWSNEAGTKPLLILTYVLASLGSLLLLLVIIGVTVWLYRTRCGRNLRRKKDRALPLTPHDTTLHNRSESQSRSARHSATLNSYPIQSRQRTLIPVKFPSYKLVPVFSRKKDRHINSAQRGFENPGYDPNPRVERVAAGTLIKREVGTNVLAIQPASPKKSRKKPGSYSGNVPVKVHKINHKRPNSDTLVAHKPTANVHPHRIVYINSRLEQANRAQRVAEYVKTTVETLERKKDKENGVVTSGDAHEHFLDANALHLKWSPSASKKHYSTT